MNTTYHGETDAKRIARMHAFRSILQSDIYRPRPSGVVLSLAGHRPRDIGCFKMAGITPERMMYVENDPERKKGLAWVKAQWPGVSTFFGDVKRYLKNTNVPISIFNADLTTKLGDEELSIFEAAAPRLRDGSVVIYTFFRGRENEYGSNLVRPHFEPDDDVEDKDHKRFHIAYSRIRDILGAKSTRVIHALRYDARCASKKSRHSPMGIIVFKKAHGLRLGPCKDPIAADEQLLWGSPNIMQAQTRAMLTNAVRYLFWKGHSNVDVSSIMNLGLPSVRAWRAHETRGTYPSPPTGETHGHVKGSVGAAKKYPHPCV